MTGAAAFYRCLQRSEGTARAHRESQNRTAAERHRRRRADQPCRTCTGITQSNDGNAEGTASPRQQFLPNNFASHDDDRCPHHRTRPSAAVSFCGSCTSAICSCPSLLPSAAAVRNNAAAAVHDHDVRASRAPAAPASSDPHRAAGSTRRTSKYDSTNRSAPVSPRAAVSPGPLVG